MLNAWWDPYGGSVSTTCPPTMGKIMARPEVGGLHHRYERLAA